MVKNKSTKGISAFNFKRYRKYLLKWIFWEPGMDTEKSEEIYIYLSVLITSVLCKGLFIFQYTKTN